MAKNKFNLSGLSDVEIYQLVLSGDIKRFPNNFWMEGKTPVFHPEITRYLINVVNGWVERDDIARNVSQQTFTKNKLSGMLLMLYNGSPLYPIMDAFPELNFKPWEFNKAPMRIWQGEQGKENGIVATKWLFEEKLKWSMDEIKEKASTKVFKEYRLGGMLANVYDDSLWKCLDTVYPEEFVPWEIGYHMNKNCWTQETAIIATKWLFEDKLKWTQEEIMKNIGADVFRKNGLGGLLHSCYKNSPFDAFISAYPNLMIEFDMPNKPKGFWDVEENIIKAIRKLISEKFKWDRKMVTEKFTGRLLVENGFAAVITKANPHNLITLAFPEWDIKPWELKRSTRFHYWNEDTIKLAVKWMIIEKMKLTKDEALKKVKRQDFVDYGIGGLLQHNRGSLTQLIEYAYDE